MLVRLLYVSRLAHSVTADDVARIVANAHRKNRQLDLTGVLIFREGRFAQVLEGREEAVDLLMSRIVLDPRHEDVQVQARVPILRRLFASWNMAFVEDLQSSLEFDRLVGGSVTAESFLVEVLELLEGQRG